MSVGQLSVGIILSLIDRFTPELDRVQSRLGSLSTGIAKAGTVMTGAGMAVGAMGERVLAPVRSAADSAMRFESAMADVAKVVDFPAPDGLATMAGQLDRMTHTIPLAAEDLAAIAAAGGQLGIAAADLTGYVDTVAKMSTAFDMVPAAAGDAMAKLSNVFEIPIAQIGDVGDAINHLSNNSAAKASEIVEATSRVAGVAKDFGLTAVQASGLTSSLIAMGKSPEVAATAVNGMLIKLKTATGQGKKFQAALKSMGMTAEGLEKSIGEDAQGALDGFLQTLSTVDAQQRTGVLVDLFGMEYAPQLSALTGNLEGYNKAMGLVGDATAYGGSMQEEFATRAATTQNALTLLGNRMSSVGRTLGAALLPPLAAAAERIGAVVTRVGDWLQAHPRLTGALVMGAAGLGVFLAALSPVLIGFGALAIGAAATFKGIALLGPAATAAGGGIRAGMMAAAGGVRALSVALLTNPIGLAIAGIAGAALLIYKYWEPISGFFSGLWSGLTAGLAPVGAAIESALAPLAEMAQRWLAPLGALLAPVGSWFTTAFAPVAAALAAPINALRDLWTWVTNILAPVQDVGGAAESMGQRWGLAIAGMIGKAAELIGAFAGLAGRFAQIGAEIVQGLINGFTAKWGALKAKVGELAGGIVATAKGALGIKSPSTIFAEIGRYSVQGIEVGLAARAPALLDRIRETAARFAAVPLLAGALGVAAMPAQTPATPSALPSVAGANPALRLDDPASAARDTRRAAWLEDARERTAPRMSALAPSAPALPQARAAGGAAPLGGPPPLALDPMPVPVAPDARAPRDAQPAGVGPISITVNVNGNADGQDIAARIRREVESILRTHAERDALARRGRMFD